MMTEPVNLATLDANKNFPKFMNPFDTHGVFDGVAPYSLIEQRMMKVLEAIKDKPYWYEKIKDENIRNKWRAEITNQNVFSHESHLQYVFDELIYFSNLSSRQLSPASVDGVWMSDHIIDDVLRQRLSGLAAPLEATCTDFHPGSNEQMLDLVHPHMHLYVNGLSKEVVDENLPWSEFIGAGDVVERATKLDVSKSYDKYEEQEYVDIMTSATYQWLPSEVHVDGAGKCKFLSYINNLHPYKHAELCGVLEQVLEKFIPLFNQVLTDLAYVPLSIFNSDPPHYWQPGWSHHSHFNVRDRRHKPNMYSNKLWILPESLKAGRPSAVGCAPGVGSAVTTVIVEGDEAEASPAVDEWEHWEDDYEYFSAHKILDPAYKVVPPFQPPAPVDPVDLKGSRLQVIVKLANIILTPDKPEYNGGNWHIEGMKNECIVASGIHYWHSENITESNLSFRTSITPPEYEQCDDRAVLEVYCLATEMPLVQDIGSVTCVQGRSLAWPNILQHKVEGFRLEDPTKPGVRKILVFFLVDPGLRVLSTAHIPPQQQAWMEMELDRLQVFSRFLHQYVILSCNMHGTSLTSGPCR